MAEQLIDEEYISRIILDTFNREQALEYLRENQLSEDSLADSFISRRIRLITRVHGLEKHLGDPLLQNLSSNKFSITLKLIHAQILKYACLHNGQFVSSEQICGLFSEHSIELNDDDEISNRFKIEYNSELVFALCSLQDVSDSLLERIHKVQKINAKAKSELSKLIVKSQIQSQIDYPSEYERVKCSSEFHNVSRGKQGGLKFQKSKTKGHSGNIAHAVKAQQITTEKCEETCSEKEQLLNLNLTNALNSRTKSIVQGSKTADVLPPEETNSESQQAWYRTTYYEVENLKDLAAGKKAISSSDQTYLQDKLRSQFGFASAESIIKMVAEAFYYISERQRISYSICKDLFELLLSNDSKFKGGFQKWVLSMAPRCFARDPSYFTNDIQNTLTRFMNSCNNNEWKQKIFEIFTDMSGDSKYVDLFKVAIENLENYNIGENIRLKSIQYVSLQSLNPNRVRVLFPSEIVTQLLRILSASSKISKEVGEIVENYLEHAHTPGVSLDDLEKLSVVAKDSKDIQLKACLVRIILKTLLEKTDSTFIPTQILKSLVEISCYPDDVLSTVVLVGLKYLSAKVAIPNVEQLGPFLIKDSKISEEELRFTATENSDDDVEEKEETKIFVSSIAAEILLNSKQHEWIKDKSFVDSMVIVNFVIQAMESSPDKQTRILTAEFLYRASSRGVIPSNYLAMLTQFCNDPVSDVKMYSTCTFATGMKDTSEESPLISIQLLESLTQIFVRENIIFDSKSYKEEINSNILETLENEAKKREVVFTTGIFNLLGELLSSEKPDEEIIQVVGILNSFCSSNTDRVESFSIPHSIISALEMLLCCSADVIERVDELLIQIILLGQCVSENVLKRFFNRLLDSSVDDAESCELIELALRANESHDLPNSLFSIVKMELLSFAFRMASSGNLLGIQIFGLWEHLSNFVSHGQKMTHSNFTVMFGLINEGEIQDLSLPLRCFMTASQNGQSISNEILEVISGNEDWFEQNLETFIPFCLALLKNNQSLPDQMTIWLTNQFETNYQNKFLPLVLLPARMGKKLSDETVLKLVDIFQTAEECVESDIFQVLIMTTKNVKSWEAKRSLCDTFFKIIHKHRPKWTPSIIKSLSNLVLNQSDILIDNEINTLVEILKKGQQEPETVLVLKSILRSYSLSEEQNQAIAISDIILNLSDPAEFLYELSQILGFANFTISNEACLEKIHIILQCDNKQLLIQAMIIMSNHFIHVTSGIMHTILETIANILVTSNDTELETQCQNSLLLFLQESEIKFSKTLVASLESNFEVSKVILEAIDDERYEFNQQTRFILDINKLNLVTDEELLNEILSRISRQVVSGFQLRSQNAKVILSLQTPSKHFIQLISNLLLNSQLEVDENVAHLVANCLVVENDFNLTVCNALHVVLRKFPEGLGVDNLENIESFLTNKYENIASFEEQFSILRCLLEVTKCKHQMLENTVDILVDNLMDSEPSVRHLSFQALRVLQSNGQNSPKFLSHITYLVSLIKTKIDVADSFHTNSLSEIEMNILETIISIKTLDFDKLSQIEQSHWQRELLLSNFVAIVTQIPSQKFRILEKIEQIFEIQVENGHQCEILQFLTQLSAVSDSFEEMEFLIDSIISLHFAEVENLFKSGVTVNQKKQIQILTISDLLGLKSNLIYELRYNLSVEILSATGFQLSKQILVNVSEFGDVKKLKEILELIKNFKVRKLNIEKGSTLSDLKYIVELNILHSTMKQKIVVYAHNGSKEKLNNLVGTLLRNGLSFDTLFRLLTSNIPEPKTVAKISSLYYVLQLILFYNLEDPIVQNIISAIRSFKPEEWFQAANEVVIRDQKEGSGLKSISHVVHDVAKSLRQNQDLLNLIRVSELEDQIAIIKEGSVPSVFQELNNAGNISTWDNSDIKDWAQTVRASFKKLTLQINYEFSIEALCVAKRAFYLHANFHLTNVQIVAILVGLNKGLKGQLQQVATGSGKSTIVAILAVINALRCKTVDIYTSSPVLAERDAKSWEKFYSIFNLTCSHNGDQGTYVKGLKSCYNSNIVYGETSMFQFDYLRHQYSNLETIGTRKQNFAIVDEVDCMFVDDISKLARLSYLLPGMDLLQILYHVTWHRLFSIESKLFSVGSNIYFMEGKTGYSDDNIAFLEFAEKDSGEIKRIDDVLGYILLGKDLPAAGITPVNNLQEFISEHLTNFLKTLTTNEKIDGFDSNEESRIKIPKNLQLFVQNQIPKWVANCMTAMTYEENVHYIVGEGQIKPVDYNTTGIVQNSTSWSGGLHQFLQIKHGLKVTSETLTTNFLSNLSMFQKYKRKFKVKGEKISSDSDFDDLMNMEKLEFQEYNIIGFTGTLGSQHTRDTMGKLYNVNCVEMPLTHFKKYVQYPDSIVFNLHAWKQEILDSATHETKKGRGVLVICETIKDAQEIANSWKTERPGIPFKMYIHNNENQEEQIERIQPGVVFIATNLAGRGTDIKTEEIERFGGLHVILTFLPTNIRVEEQAFGRTSRQDHLGSGQLICISDLLTASTSNLRKHRDQIQNEQLNSFLETELPLVKAKDKCFSGFCKFLKTVRENFKEQDSIWSTLKTSVGIERNQSALEFNVLQAIEERWAMFLLQLDDRNIQLQQAWGYYKLFELKMILDCKKEKIIKSPFYHIAIANDFFIRDSKYKNYNSEARKHYKAAIELDEEFSTAAYVGLGYLNIRGTLNIVASDNHTHNYKTEAISILQKSLPFIQSEIANVVSAQSLFQVRGGDMESGLFKQLTMKQNALNSYLNCIQNAIRICQNSIRGPNIVGVSSKSGQRQMGVPYGCQSRDFIFSDESIDSCKQNCSRLSNRGFENFHVEFNDLTVSQDSGAIDQALKTIDKSGPKKENVEIHCKSAKFDNLVSMLFKDRYAPQMLRENAIVCLKTWEKENSTLFGLIKTSKPKIDVEFLSEGGEPVEANLLQNIDIDKAIGKVETLGENECVNLVYKSGNEDVPKIYSKLDMSIEVCDIKTKNSMELLESTFKASSITLNIKSDDLKDIFTNLGKANLNELEINLKCHKEDGTWESESVSLTTVQCSSLFTKADEISISNLSSEKAKIVILQCPENCSVNLKFTNVDKSSVSISCLRKVKHLLQNINISLRDSHFKKAIPQLRKDHINFSVVLRNLDAKKAQNALNNADLSQEDIQQSKQTLLQDLFSSEWMPVSELWEFYLRGIVILCEFNEKSPVPWFSIGCVLALAAVQMAVGGVLIATGFGATVGMGLITEGAADIFTAYRAYSNRQFSWEDYAKQKAISLVISAVSMGWGKLKDAAKGAKVAVEGATKEVGEQIGTQIIMKGKGALGSVIKNSGSNLKTLAMKQVGVAVGEAAAREGFNALMTLGSQFAISQMKPQIVQTVEKRVAEKFFSNPEMRKLLAFYWALDKVGKSKTLDDKIKRVVSEVTNPKSDVWTSQWNSLGLPLCQGILSSAEHVGGYASWGFRIYGILNGLKEISTVIQYVSRAVVEKLISENKMAVNVLLLQQCKLEPSKVHDVAKLVELDSSESSYFKYSVSKGCEKKLADFFSQVNSEQLKFKMEVMDMTMKDMTNNLSEHIIKIADTQMRAPITTFMVGKGVASLSAYVQHNFIVSSKHHTSELEGKKLITVGDQINANAKEFTIAYQQMDINRKIAEIKALSAENKPSQQVLEKTNGILNDEPADLAVMSTLAKLLGKELTLVTDLKDAPISKDDKDSNKITILFEAGKVDPLTGETQVGHFSLVDSKTGEIVPMQDTNPSSMNCGYDIFSSLTGGEKTVGELRLSVAEFVLDHPKNFSKVVDNEKWIMSHYPREANGLLFVGGVEDKDKRKLFPGDDKDDKRHKPSTSKDVDDKKTIENLFDLESDEKKVQIKVRNTVTLYENEEDKEAGVNGIELPSEQWAFIPLGVERVDGRINVLQKLTEAMNKIPVLEGKNARLHIVNNNAGGPPDEINLVPGTKSMNRTHTTRFESHLKNFLNDNKNESGGLILKTKIVHAEGGIIAPIEGMHISIGTTNPDIQDRINSCFGNQKHFQPDHRSDGRTQQNITLIKEDISNTAAVDWDSTEVPFTSSADISEWEDKDEE